MSVQYLTIQCDSWLPVTLKGAGELHISFLIVW